VDTTFINPDVNGEVFSTVVQTDGKIIIGGAFTSVGGTTRNGIARLNADGTLDSAFNPNAFPTVSVRRVALDAAGKILVGGNFTSIGGSGRNRMARLNKDGSQDTDFRSNVGDPGVDSIAVQADGKIIIAGVFELVNGITRKSVARLNTDGTLDTTFLADADDVIYSLIVQKDGKVIIAGQFTTLNGTSCKRIARVESGVSIATSARPDTRVGLNDATPIGNNVYNLTGAGQTITAKIRHGGGVRNVFIRVQNDSISNDSLRVRGMAGNSKFTVRYFSGTTDVTDSVLAGTFSTGTLTPGASKLLRAKITARTQRVGQQRALSVFATSANDITKRDTALISLRSR